MATSLGTNVIIVMRVHCSMVTVQISEEKTLEESNMNAVLNADVNAHVDTDTRATMKVLPKICLPKVFLTLQQPCY